MDFQYKGMTVNERLYTSGLMEEFDKAVNEKDAGKVVEILKEVEITDESAVRPILEKLGFIQKSKE